MADKKPVNFLPLITSQLSVETEAYTQRPGSGVADGDYKYTFAQLTNFLVSQSFVKVMPGTHIDDAAAITAVGSVGDSYELTINNNYNIRFFRH